MACSIEAVIFDWAGTTVDYGCFAPVNAFAIAFGKFAVEVTDEEIRKPMGMLKIDHIRTMLSMERIAKLWQDKYGRTPDENDVNAIYDVFEESLLESLEQYAEPKPYVTDTVAELRSMGIKIGSTTGYTDKMMGIVTAEAEKQGYKPDVWISPDSVGGAGRPYPYMIFENLKRLGVSSVKNVVKVGDTISDIREGVNAGVISVGVVDGSSELGMRGDEFEALGSSEKEAARERVREGFRNAGADYVIDDLSKLTELPCFR